ncbi:hypothetical protein [Synechococcus sp. PCC 7336]|uniref:hypothetical protein n=1 Tax=Synechococcus sp. PCC 7336 TaxID=195250 RepID=UPI00036B3C79|nr:hypothetical protein [Synechococcus sp. PCC 7336]
MLHRAKVWLAAGALALAGFGTLAPSTASSVAVADNEVATSTIRDFRPAMGGSELTPISVERGGSAIEGSSQPIEIESRLAGYSAGWQFVSGIAFFALAVNASLMSVYFLREE